MKFCSDRCIWRDLNLRQTSRGSCLDTHSNFPPLSIAIFLGHTCLWCVLIFHFVLHWFIRWQILSHLNEWFSYRGIWNVYSAFFLKFSCFKCMTIFVVMPSSYSFRRWFCYFWSKGEWNKWSCLESLEIHLTWWSWHTLLQFLGPLCNLQWILIFLLRFPLAVSAESKRRLAGLCGTTSWEGCSGFALWFYFLYLPFSGLPFLCLSFPRIPQSLKGWDCLLLPIPVLLGNPLSKTLGLNHQP